MTTTKNTRKKNFGSPKNAELEPLVFTLYKEDFECYPEAQGALLMRFSEEVASEEQDVVMKALREFFSKVVKPDDYPRLLALFDDPERVVPIETLSDIIAWLVEEYTSRPTPASEES